MTLQELTGKDSGIVLYNRKTVGVYNWADADENAIPVLSPDGLLPFSVCQGEDVFAGVREEHVDDVRELFDATVWYDAFYGDIATDIDIVYDANNDITRLFLDNRLTADDYEGTAYHLANGMIIVAMDAWD